MTDKQNYFTYTDNTSDNNEKIIENLHKQIMIDGVDVSGCDFLAKKDDYCSYSGVTYAYKGQCMCSDEEMCKEHPKCFYKKVLKQLKIKEQECEEKQKTAQDAISKLCAEKSTLCNELDQLKAENRKLKAVHSTNVALSDELFKYKAENKRLKEARKNSRCAWKSLEDTLCPEAQEQLDKLKQTLTEIKSILELYANSKVGEEQPDGTYQLSSGIGGSFGFGFGVCTTTYDPRPARQALQKISEVEE